MRCSNCNWKYPLHFFMGTMCGICAEEKFKAAHPEERISPGIALMRESARLWRKNNSHDGPE